MKYGLLHLNYNSSKYFSTASIDNNNPLDHSAHCDIDCYQYDCGIITFGVGILLLLVSFILSFAWCLAVYCCY